jgi:hypothetical protein
MSPISMLHRAGDRESASTLWFWDRNRIITEIARKVPVPTRAEHRQFRSRMPLALTSIMTW